MHTNGRSQRYELPRIVIIAVLAITAALVSVASAATPTITSFTPIAGPPGTYVTITGSGFTNASAVTFNGAPASGYHIDSDTQIVAQVPVNVTTGPISVTTPEGTATSTQNFTYANFRADGVIPMFCGNNSPPYVIPSNVPLQVRLGWASKNRAQSDQFRNSQKLVWSVTREADNTIFDSRLTPNPEYGDTTEWSSSTQRPDGLWFTNYQHNTGKTLAVDETVRIRYTLTANTKTDDGFSTWAKYTTIDSGNSCTVTGVAAGP